MHVRACTDCVAAVDVSDGVQCQSAPYIWQLLIHTIAKATANEWLVEQSHEIECIKITELQKIASKKNSNDINHNNSDNDGDNERDSASIHWIKFKLGFQFFFHFWFKFYFYIFVASICRVHRKHSASCRRIWIRILWARLDFAWNKFKLAAARLVDWLIGKAHKLILISHES